MSKRGCPPRNMILAANEAGRITPELPWWRLRRPWPKNLRFKDGATEEVIDRTPLPPPWHPGAVGCSAQACVDSYLAERASRGRQAK
jgi:hypothetical protein